jgi:hypothetical protein
MSFAIFPGCGFKPLRIAWLLGATAACLCGASWAQMNSPRAAIALTAVLPQSLSISTAPEGVPFNSFLSSKSGFPLKIRARWVRGPGQVSIVVFTEHFDAGEQQQRPVLTSDPAGRLDWEINTGEVTTSGQTAAGVLTVRAQAI